MKWFVLVLILIACGGLVLPSALGRRANPRIRTATFAGGCFWGVQAAFDRAPGVVLTEAGYTGGTDPHPTHTSVAMGHTGHVEAVRVTYDARRVSYAELLDVFWSCHNPTLDMRTAPHEGPARSMIFVADARQSTTAERSLNELSAARIYDAPIMTEIAPATTFYPAEAEHQHFAAGNGGGRCTVPGPTVHTRLAASARRLREAY